MQLHNQSVITVTPYLPAPQEYLATTGIVQSLDPVVPSVQDGVRTTKDETVSSSDGTDCLGAVLDGVDGRRLQTREIAQ